MPKFFIRSTNSMTLTDSEIPRIENVHISFNNMYPDKVFSEIYLPL